ncbi:A-kinase anchor protein 12 [Centroberyx affinis]|uniref:A-kinase anchor protein 12 n=1 Tax=Centroberyx affinis TaxID=166261 RepID=UPI003A5C62D8
MDPPGPFSRAQRSFWTVWNYISEAVTRFLRPEADNTGNNDTNSVQESTADSEPGNVNSAESDIRGGGGDEEQATLTTVSVVDSSRPVVAWELCNIDISLGPDKEKMQYITPFNRGSDDPASEEGEGMREEQVAQTGNEDTGLLIAKDVGAKEKQEEKNSDENLYLFERVRTRTQELEEYEEHENIRSPNLTDDAVSEDMGETGRKTGPEEEIDAALIPDDQQIVDETMRNFQVRDQEEDKEIILKDEPGDFKDPFIVGSLGTEEIEGKLCMFTEMSPEEEDNMYVEELHKNEEDAGATYEASMREENESSDDVLQVAHLNITTSIGSSTEDGHLMVSEDMEEEQDSKLNSTGHTENSFDMVVEGYTGALCLTNSELLQATEKPLAEPVNDTVTQASGHLLVVEVGQLDTSMKMGSQQSEKTFETNVGSADETGGTEEDLYDRTEEPLVEFELDGELLCDSREADAGETAGVEDGLVIETDKQHEETTAVTAEDVIGYSDETLKFSETELQKMTETRLSDESIDAIKSEQNSSTSSPPEDITEFSLMKSVVTEPQLPVDDNVEQPDIALEMQDAMLDIEEIDSRVEEEEAAESESENKNDTEVLNLQVVEMAAGLTKETDEKENALIAGSESSRDTNTEPPIESMETKHQLSNELLETTNEETMIDTELSDSESGNVNSAESDISGGGGDEELAILATASVVDSSPPVVAWELCNIDLESGKENMQYVTSFNSGEGEGMREEQVAQTGDEDTGLLIAKDAGAKEEQEEKNSDGKLYLCMRDGTRTQELEEYEEHENIRSPNLTDDAVSEDMAETGRKTGPEEEIDAALIPDDQQIVDETMRNFQVKDQGEDKELFLEDQPGHFKDPYIVGSLGADEIGGKLCMFTEMSAEVEDNMYVEDAGKQKNEADAGVTYENSLKSNEGLVDPARQDQEPVAICEEVSDEDRDVKEDPGVSSSDVALHVDLHMAYNKSSVVADDEITVVRQEEMMLESTERTANNKVEDQKEEEDGSIVVEREQGVTTEEENVNQGEAIANNKILDKGTEQEDDIEAVTEDSKEEEHIVTEHITCSEGVTQNATIEVHRDEFEDGNQDYEADDLEMETKPSDEDAVEKKCAGISGISEHIHHGTMSDKKAEEATVNIPVDEGFVGTEKDNIDEESENEKTESHMDRACTVSTVTVTAKPDSNNGGEISRELKNISLGTCEGPVAVPQDLNCGAWAETQEGVPEYNNGHKLDENTTQSFLEVGDYEEIQTTQLPEGVESKEPESFQNIGSSTEAGHLLMSEHMEEEQGSKRTEHTENSFDMVVEGHTGILCLTNNELPQETEKPLGEAVNDTATQASGHLLVEVERLDALMKTDSQQSEKTFETNVGSADETSGTEEDLYDRTEGPLVELELDGEIGDSREADAGETASVEDGLVIETDKQHEETTAVTAEDVVGYSDETVNFFETELQKMTETRLSDESIDAIMSEQNSSGNSSLPKDTTESSLMSVETEPKLLEDNNVEQPDIAIELQDAVLDIEEMDFRVEEEEAAESESENKNDTEVLNLQVVEMAAGLTKETDGKENALIAGSESSRDSNTEPPIESVETKHQLSSELLETRNEETTIDTELSDESMEIEPKPKDTLMLSTETEMATHEMRENVTESEESYAEAAGSSVIGHANETDEEILDMWIETVLPQDTDDKEPKILIETEESKPLEEPEVGPQTDIEMQPSEVGSDEAPSVQTEKEKEQLLGLNSGESGLVSDSEISSSAAESGLLDQSLGEWSTPKNGAQLLNLTGTGSFQGVHGTSESMPESAEVSELSAKQPEAQDELMKETAEAGQSFIEEGQSICAIPGQTGFLGNPPDSTGPETRHNELPDKSQEKVESVESDTGLQREIDLEIDESEPAKKTDWKEAEEVDVKSLLFEVEQVQMKDEPLEKIVSNSPNEIKHSGQYTETEEAESVLLGERSESEAWSGEESASHGETSFERQDQPGRSEAIAESLPGINTEEEEEEEEEDEEEQEEEDEEEPRFTLPPRTKSGDQCEVDASILDFSAQKSRIAVKNRRVRPPKDPRTLLQRPSVDPTPSVRLPVKGVPLGGLGIGIKLPGFGAGFPVLKKTRKVVKDEDNTESSSQKSATEPEVKDEAPKQEEAEHKPKWMPPRHPGFGNPLMSELKNKLKKTTKE